MVRRELVLHVSYQQFYVWDPAMPFEPPTDWTEADVDGGLKEAPHFLAVAPVRDGVIPLIVELHEQPPPVDLALWDHAVEGSLEVRSGRLQVQEWSGVRQWDVEVQPGWYRLRALFANLGSAFVEGEPEADWYLLAIWPSPPSGVSVLKQFRLEL